MATLSRFLLALWLLTPFTASAAEAPDERVNPLPTAQELAQRESCPDGGVLRYAGEPPYGGLPWHLIAALPAIGRQHAALTQNEPTWVRRLSGSSQPVRLYENQDRKVVVFDLCMPHRCDVDSLYGVVDLPTNDYGVILKESEHFRRVGRHTPITDAAVSCAQFVDERNRKP